MGAHTRPLLLALAASAALLPLTPTQAVEVRRLKPSSNWVLDYAKENCRLARHFGQGRDRVTLVMDQFSPGNWFQMILVGESVRPRSPVRPIKAILRFGPNESPREVTGVEGTSGARRIFIVNGGQRLVPLTKEEEKARTDAWKAGVYVEDKPIDQVRERAATWLELNDVFKFDLVLETGTMDKPLASLRACSWDLVGSWGLDVPQQQALSRHVLAKRDTSWFSSNDYPTHMLRSGSEAIVHVRMMVNEGGEPTSCHIQESTRPKAFDDVVCKILMKRARFNPALDAQGRPVKSYFQQSVTFRME